MSVSSYLGDKVELVIAIFDVSRRPRLIFLVSLVDRIAEVGTTSGAKISESSSRNSVASATSCFLRGGGVCGISHLNSFPITLYSAMKVFPHSEDTPCPCRF